MTSSSTEWNESNPSNSDLVNEGDDEIRAIKGATRARMAIEHIWPASQAAVAEAGLHKYITFQPQTSTPSLIGGTNTQVGAFYMSTDKHMVWVDSAGTNYIVMQSAKGLVFFSGTATLGVIPYVTSGGGLAQLTASAAGLVLVTQTNTGAPIWTGVSALMGVSVGSTNHGGTITLPAGFASAQCSIFVSGRDLRSATGTSCPDGIAPLCLANGTVMTCTWTSVNNNAVTGTGIGNYMVIGTK